MRLHTLAVRIGTWNMAGRWTSEHLEFVLAADCEVWLFTEVNERVDIAGYEQHWCDNLMAPKRRWAAVYSRLPMKGLEDPHFASAAAVIDGVTFCSSILPWKGSGGEPTWPGERHAGRTEAALEVLLKALPESDLIWGGDWNHALSGNEWAGSKAGRAHVLAAVERLGLTVSTAKLPHRLDGHLSIDHIAVPLAGTVVLSATHLPAVGLSDHDAYVVELAE